MRMTAIFTINELIQALPIAFHAASSLKDTIVNSLMSIITSTPSNFSLAKLIIAIGCIRILWSLKSWIASDLLHHISI